MSDNKKLWVTLDEWLAEKNLPKKLGLAIVKTRKVIEINLAHINNTEKRKK